MSHSLHSRHRDSKCLRPHYLVYNSRLTSAFWIDSSSCISTFNHRQYLTVSSSRFSRCSISLMGIRVSTEWQPKVLERLLKLFSVVSILSIWLQHLISHLFNWIQSDQQLEFGSYVNVSRSRHVLLSTLNTSVAAFISAKIKFVFQLQILVRSRNPILTSYVNGLICRTLWFAIYHIDHLSTFSDVQQTHWLSS